MTPPRVHLYGDSFVAGFGDPLGVGWVGQISARCAAAGAPIEVANHGVPGETSVQAVARFFNTRIEPPVFRDRKELAVFSFGTNDVITATTPDQSSAALRSALQLAAEISLPAFVVGPPPVGDLPEADARLIALSRDFEEICKSSHVPFIEVHAELSAGGAWADEARAGDGSHPQSAGYEQLADLLDAGGLTQWLRSQNLEA